MHDVGSVSLPDEREKLLCRRDARSLGKSQAGAVYGSGNIKAAPCAERNQVGLKRLGAGWIGGDAWGLTGKDKHQVRNNYGVWNELREAAHHFTCVC